MSSSSIERKIRVLQLYCGAVTLAMLVLFGAAASRNSKQKFDEIDVERINVVEKDGKVRLIITNEGRSPEVIIGGKEVPGRAQGKTSALYFYNDRQDEVGGLFWYSREKDGKYIAASGLHLDQYRQDQTLGMTYSDESGNRFAGFRVWDRPNTPAEELMPRLQAMEKMPDGPEKEAAYRKFRDEGLTGSTRILLGKGVSRDAVLSLADGKGRPRILLVASEDGKTARLDFLDETGKVIQSFPNASVSNEKK
jgi:hypothetical protein